MRLVEHLCVSRWCGARKSIEEKSDWLGACVSIVLIFFFWRMLFFWFVATAFFYEIPTRRAGSAVTYSVPMGSGARSFEPGADGAGSDELLLLST